MRRLFLDVKIDWLSKAKYFIGGSLLLLLIGMVSIVRNGGPLLGIDFKGGTLVYVRFAQAPDLQKIRSGLASQGLGDATLQQIRDIANSSTNEVMIGIEQKGQGEESLNVGRAAIVTALNNTFGASGGGFEIRNVEVVGPKVGAQLQKQALLATFSALAGMLVYVAFRFELIYGSAAVLAVFHDALITLGLMSIFGYELSLTVIAALLTLVGYSMNDTIVIFDRMRENLRLMRRESLATIANTSINQTLSRTLLTSGLTFLTVLVLYLMGGQVLRAFSFALVVGIVVGTYSSFGIAVPLIVAWDKWKGGRGQEAPASSSAEKKNRTGNEPGGQLAAAARR